MKRDRSNAASLARMEEELRELGNHAAANRLARSLVVSWSVESLRKIDE